MAVDTLLADVGLALRQCGLTVTGLGEPELWQLERAVGARFPRCLRVTLTRTGMRENPFGLFSTEREWVRATDRLYDQLHRGLATGEIGPASDLERIVRDEQLIAFAPERPGAVFVLRGADDEGHDVLRFDPAKVTLLESLGESFETWARRAWSEARKQLGVAQRRAIQFSFWSPTEYLLDRLAMEVGGALDPDWSSPVESATGVVSWEQMLYIEVQAFRVRRMEHPSWRVPLVSVIVADAEPGQDNGWVAWFRDGFRRAGIEVNEVDLGPIAKPARYRSSFGSV